MNFDELLEEYHNQKVEMTNEERREAYWNGEEVDFLPFELNGVDIAVVDNLGYTTSDMARSEAVKDKVEKTKLNVLGIDDDIVGVNYAGIMGSVQIMPENGTPYIAEHFLSDYSKFSQLPSSNDIANNPIINKSLDDSIELKNRFPQLHQRIITNGPWSSIGKIRSVESLLRDIRKNKKELIDLLEYVVDYNTKLIEHIVNRVGKLDIFMTDPISSLDLISVKQFEELSFPYLKELTDNIYSITCKKVDLHICGHSKGFWDYLSKLNIRLFSVDNLESISDLKNQVGDFIGISGNIPPLEVFQQGSIDDVINSVKKCIELSADCKNGFIIDAGCQLPLNVPKENLYAYVYAVRKYGAGAKIGELPNGLR